MNLTINLNGKIGNMYIRLIIKNYKFLKISHQWYRVLLFAPKEKIVRNLVIHVAPQGNLIKLMPNRYGGASDNPFVVHLQTVGLHLLPYVSKNLRSLTKL